MVHEFHFQVRINLHHNDFQLHRNDSTVYCYSRRIAPSLEIGHRKPLYTINRNVTHVYKGQREFNSILNHKYVTVRKLGIRGL
jgi:hypothetical protein